MAEHVEANLEPADSKRLEGLAWPTFVISLSVGIGGLLLALIVALILQGLGGDGMRRFGFAYLTNFAFFLSISVGALFFVIMSHLCHAGWVVTVRRIPEILAALMPTMAILFLPIVVYLAINNGMLYAWAQPLPEQEEPQPGTTQTEHADAAAHHATITTASTRTLADRPVSDPAPTTRKTGKKAAAKVGAKAKSDPVAGGHALTTSATADSIPRDLPPQPSQFPGESVKSPEQLRGSRVDDEMIELVHKKRAYLNTPFFIGRWVLYFGVFSGMGLWYWRSSTRQDLTGDAHLTHRMETFSGPGVLIFGLLLTYLGYDLLMTLDPTFYSTMFSIYFFAGSFQATMCVVILLLMLLQHLGFLPSVTIEHYHDLGKLAYAFVIFWAYVTFGQYMLIWYSAIPNEQSWMIVRGMSTNNSHATPWHWIALLMLFGRFLIPFFGFMSRHMKRNKKTLAFWAIWLLAMQWVDMYWMVMPEFDAGHLHIVVELLCLVGMGGIFFAAAVRLAARNSLISVGDPRLAESLSFTNY